MRGGTQRNLNYEFLVAQRMHTYIPDSQRNKLAKKAEKLRFVGYILLSMKRIPANATSKVVIRRDVVFNETVFRETDSQTSISVRTEPILSEAESESEELEGHC